jgi:hypothetical protein
LPDRGIVGHRPLDIGFAVGTSQIAGVLPGRRFVLHSADAPRPVAADSLVRPSVPILVSGPGVGAGRTVSEVPGAEMVPVETRFRGRPLMVSRPLRLGRRAHIVVWDTLIATAAGEGYRIDLVNIDGRVIARLVVPVPRRSVTPAMREAAIADELELLRRKRQRLVDPEETRRLIRESPFADSLPPYEAFYPTPDGTLWVVDAIAPGDTAWKATAFRRDGSARVRLHAAGRARPLAFGDGRVIVRTRGADGVVRLRAYRLPISQ